MCKPRSDFAQFAIRVPVESVEKLRQMANKFGMTIPAFVRLKIVEMVLESEK